MTTSGIAHAPHPDRPGRSLCGQGYRNAVLYAITAEAVTCGSCIAKDRRQVQRAGEAAEKARRAAQRGEEWRRHREQRAAPIIEMRAAGRTWNSIAAEMGVTQERCRQIVARAAEHAQP